MWKTCPGIAPDMTPGSGRAPGGHGQHAVLVAGIAGGMAMTTGGAVVLDYRRPRASQEALTCKFADKIETFNHTGFQPMPGTAPDA